MSIPDTFFKYSQCEDSMLSFAYRDHHHMHVAYLLHRSSIDSSILDLCPTNKPPHNPLNTVEEWITNTLELHTRHTDMQILCITQCASRHYVHARQQGTELIPHFRSL